jgi:hypothetical protein
LSATLKNSKIKLWKDNGEKYECIKKYISPVEVSLIESIKLLDNNLLAFLLYDNKIILWKNFKYVQNLIDNSDSKSLCNICKFLSNKYISILSNNILVTFTNNKIQIWKDNSIDDSINYECIKTLTCDSNIIDLILLNNNRFASLSYDGMLILWENEKIIDSIKCDINDHDYAHFSIFTFSIDSIAIKCKKNTIKVFKNNEKGFEYIETFKLDKSNINNLIMLSNDILVCSYGFSIELLKKIKKKNMNV